TTGQAYVAALEEQLTQTDLSAAERVELTSQLATVYYQIGGNEGLQANFQQLLATPAAARSVMDSVLFGIVEPNTNRILPARAQQYVTLADAYGKAHPDAPESPEQLYKAAEIARSIGAYQRSLNLYSTIENYFPKYEKAPKALFMQAFIQTEDLKNEDEARRLYELFLEKYPEDDFVDDAQMMLDNLGKTDEEIFQALEEKRKALEEQ
ncbi:MAG: hypothetical protein AAGJ82_10320, partial [Bacteroidota bacterium]